VGGEKLGHRARDLYLAAGEHDQVRGDPFELGEGLVEHQQPGAPGERDGQRELCLLAAGQLADLLPRLDAEPFDAVFRVRVQSRSAHRLRR
jgi:hypothetical protein